MSGRLGPWSPATLEERVDRMESLAAIRQLAMRYGRALDARDMPALADLFAPDVQLGFGEQGREALQAWYAQIMRRPHTSIHFVINHVVDFQDADHATGVVYCRDELEQPETGEWEVGTIQYWDTYDRTGGEWCFRKRVFHRWYLVDALTRPAHGAGVNAADRKDPLYARQLPEAWPTWSEFWSTPTD